VPIPHVSRKPKIKIAKLGQIEFASHGDAIAAPVDFRLRLFGGQKQYRPLSGHLIPEPFSCAARHRYDRLVKAWNAASDDDRAQFVALIGPVSDPFSPRDLQGGAPC
jgi:hypothetical protein